MLPSNIGKPLTRFIEVELMCCLLFFALFRLEPKKGVHFSPLFIPLLASPLRVKSGYKWTYPGPFGYIDSKYLLHLDYGLLRILHDCNKFKTFKFPKVLLILLNRVEMSMYPILQKSLRIFQVGEFWGFDFACLYVLGIESKTSDTRYGKIKCLTQNEGERYIILGLRLLNIDVTEAAGVCTCFNLMIVRSRYDNFLNERRLPKLDVLDLLIVIEVNYLNFVVLNNFGVSRELILWEVTSNFSLPSIAKIRKYDPLQVLVILICLDLN